MITEIHTFDDDEDSIEMKELLAESGAMHVGLLSFIFAISIFGSFSGCIGSSVVDASTPTTSSAFSMVSWTIP